VPDITATEINKPLNWQDFQRGCVPLFRHLVGDRHLQEWGREGHAQSGIDLHGYRDGDISKPVGIQCRRYKKPLSEKAMREDAEEARVLKLTELIFATTADRDVKMQTAAADITRDLHASGWPCRVVIMSWAELCLEIVKFDDVLAVFWPSGRILQQPIISAVREGTGEILTRMDRHGSDLRDLKELLKRSQRGAEEDYDPDLEPEARDEPVALHKEISQIRRFLKKGRTTAAQEELEALLVREPAIPAYARYRVLSNLAAVHFAGNRYDRALAFAREAMALRPDDPKAQTNLAYAELASGDREGAARRAQDVLASQPDNGQAASVLLQARMRDMNLTDPFAIIPAKAHGSVEFKIGAIVFLRHRDDATWRAFAADAAKRFPENDVLKRFAAEALLEPILNDPAVLVGRPVDAGAREAAGQCATILKELWSKEIAAEDVNADEIVPLAGNVASALRFCNDDAAAADVLDRTIAKVGRDAMLVRARALLHLHADEDDKAVALLDGVQTDPELKLFASQVLISRDPEKALKQLNLIDPESLPANLRPVQIEIRGEIGLRLGDESMLRDAIENLKSMEGSTVAAMLLTARGREKGLLVVEALEPKLPVVGGDEPDEIDDAEVPDERSLAPHVRELVRFVRENEPKLDFADRVMLGQYLERHGAPETASDILLGHVAFDRDTAGLRCFVSSSIAAGLAVRSKAVLAALPAPIASTPFYVRAVATHCWNVGDIEKAAPAIEQLHRSNPELLEYFDWYLQSLLRLGRSDAVRDLLNEPIEDRLQGSIGARGRLAKALHTFGHTERALRLTYRDFATNREAPAAWMSFMSVMFLAGKVDSLDLQSPIITGEHAFEVQLGDGTVRRYLIESDAVIRKIEQDALPPDHAIAKAALGKQPQDAIDLPDGSRSVITSAKHKYLDAFHSALARYNARFPTARDMKQVKVTLEGEHAFAEVTEVVKDRAEYVEGQTQTYAEGSMSVAMLAFTTGVSVIDVLVGLADSKTPYRVAIGIGQERNDAFKAIEDNGKRGCVVDTATFHCIRRLGLDDVVQAVCGRIAVTQATLDHYSERLRNLELLQDGDSGTIGYRNGRLYLAARTEAEAEQTRTVIKSDIAWLTTNADIVPVVPAQEPPIHMRRLGSMRGARFFDEVYAASGTEKLLLVDDLFTRQAGAMMGVVGTWLQPVLMIARAKGLMSAMDYAKALTDMIGAGMAFISVGPQTLVSAYQLDREAGEAGAGRRLSLAARSLGGRNADIGSHCGVAIAFLRFLWSDDGTDHEKFAATSALLRSLLSGRTEDYLEILNTLEHHVRRANFSEYLRGWTRGHFLS
jgi:tetratricopeptide (TPR) repeat protein